MPEEIRKKKQKKMYMLFIILSDLGRILRFIDRPTSPDGLVVVPTLEATNHQRHCHQEVNQFKLLG